MPTFEKTINNDYNQNDADGRFFAFGFLLQKGGH